MSADEPTSSNVRGRPPKDKRAPRGPAQVQQATIEAAGELFARRGIAAVTVRDVASAAGVNPALVHRYLGGKDEIVRIVLSTLLDRIRTDFEALVSPDVTAMPDEPEQALIVYQQIVAHLVIEGRNIRDYQTEFPLVRFVIDEIQRQTGVDDQTARIRGAQIFALGLAVRLFSPVLLHAVGFGPEGEEELRQSVRRVNFVIGRGD
jgi:TetR/AcrR family transcriptional regulator, repressor for neighboring sulfatase